MPTIPMPFQIASADTEDILGYAVYARPLGDLVQDVLGHVRDAAAGGAWLACLNPHSYAVACDNPDFGAALRRATWLVPDGAGVTLASRWISGRIRDRLCGPDVFLAISAAINARGPFKVLFLGSTEATLASVAHRYRADFPNVTTIDTHSPPFRAAFDDADIAEMRDMVRRAAPDILWVGLTAPKQELLLQRLGADAGYGFAAAIGAAFDFYAGNVQRSGPMFRRLGLEWLPRLVQEPRRLWRRTFVSAPRFLVHVASQALAARVSARKRTRNPRERS